MQVHNNVSFADQCYPQASFDPFGRLAVAFRSNVCKFFNRYVIQESYLDSDDRDGCLVKILRIKNCPELN